MSTVQKFVLSILGVVTSAAVITAPSWFMRSRLPEDQFSVTGEGRIFAPPNIAEISFGVITEKPTAEQATRENATKMNRVIEAIKAAGVEAKDIKTVQYNLYPNYHYTEPRGRELRGWTLAQNARVKIRNLDNIGGVVAKATAAGANESGDVSFTIDDEEELLKQARAEAIAKAKAKAEELSQVSGLKLGKLVNVFESSGPIYPGPVFYKNEALGVGGGDIPAPAIQPGENEIVVSVTLVYKVK